MARGRRPKPTALKKLEGNPGKRPLNELEPVPPVVSLRCPNYLLPEARKEWRRLAPILMNLGLLTAADAVPFAGYCQAYARWREAQDEITRHGSIYKDGDGRIRPNPYIADAGDQVLRGGLRAHAVQPHRHDRQRPVRGEEKDRPHGGHSRFGRGRGD